MIRLGSAAGYPFDGPRLLAGWTPPPRPGVYAILYQPDSAARPGRYAVIYAGHSENLAGERFPFRHPAAACWIRRAGDRWKVYVASFEVPGGGLGHREQIVRELVACYRPGCNSERFDPAWKGQWIGDYSAPTTGPVARRGPDGA